MAAMRIVRDPIASDAAASIPRQQWDTLMEERRRFCTQYLPKDCRNLLFFVEDGAENNWLEYGDAESYIRRGLGLEPDMVNWAVAGLNQLSGKRPIGFEVAAFIGKLTMQQVAQETRDGMRRAAGDPEGGRPKVYEKKRTPLPKGNDAQRRIARLQRDHPEIVVRLAVGEFRSVAEAVRYAAGETRGLTKLRRAWESATPEERETFADEIKMKRRPLPAGASGSMRHAASQALPKDYRDGARSGQSRAVKGERRSGMARPALQRETIDGSSSAPSAKDYRDSDPQDQGQGVLAERVALRRGPSRSPP